MRWLNRAGELRRATTRLLVNKIPAKMINAGYNTYSKIYKGQLSLGLPVSRELIMNQREIRQNAVGKAGALSLSHLPPHHRHRDPEK